MYLDYCHIVCYALISWRQYPMIEIIHKLCEALKSSGFFVSFFLALHASRTVADEEDPVPGDNFPRMTV